MPMGHRLGRAEWQSREFSIVYSLKKSPAGFFKRVITHGMILHWLRQQLFVYTCSDGLKAGSAPVRRKNASVHIITESITSIFFVGPRYP